jgi:hypothetical protein
MLASKFKMNLLKSAVKSNFLKSSLQSVLRIPFCHHDKQGGSSTSLAVRRKAPQFKGMTWWNGQFKKIDSADFQGKWVCLFFYPLDFTFVCPTEIVDFNSKSSEFEKLSIFNY